MNMNSLAKIGYAVLRIVSGLLFFHFGAMIILGWFGGMPGGKPAAVMSQTWIGGMVELIGGLAVAGGLFTRPVAFILSGEMAVAYWQFHAPNGPWPAQNQGTPAILFCFLFLYMAAQGGGCYSLDALFCRKCADKEMAKEPAQKI